MSPKSQDLVPCTSLAASCSAWGAMPAALAHCRAVLSILLSLHRDLHLQPNTANPLHGWIATSVLCIQKSKLQLRSPGWFWRNGKPNHLSRFSPLTWLSFNDLSKAKEAFFSSVYFSFYLHYSDVVKPSEISWGNLLHKCILNCINFQMVSNFVLATHTRQGLLQDSCFLSFKVVVLW